MKKTTAMSKVGRTMFEAGGHRDDFNLTYDELLVVMKAVVGSMDALCRTHT